MRAVFGNQEVELALRPGSSPSGETEVFCINCLQIVTRGISAACHGWHGDSAECEGGLETTTTSRPFPELALRFAFGKTKV